MFERHRLCISQVVLQELQLASPGLREKMLGVVEGAQVLPALAEASRLAERYVAAGIFPEKYGDDAMHVAVATVHSIPFLVSWNFKHLVKVRTRSLVNEVNLKEGFNSIEIIAPPEF